MSILIKWFVQTFQGVNLLRGIPLGLGYVDKPIFAQTLPLEMMHRNAP